MYPLIVLAQIISTVCDLAVSRAIDGHLQYLILSHSFNMLKTSSQKSLYFRLKETKVVVRVSLKKKFLCLETSCKVHWLKIVYN